ncbi:MAG: hypothetical protein R3B70_42875 [Polyangiaceae bacterium]
MQPRRHSPAPGDLDAADEHLRRSLALDPSDSIARIVQKRLATYRSGAPAPRTLRELERG